MKRAGRSLIITVLFIPAVLCASCKRAQDQSSQPQTPQDNQMLVFRVTATSLVVREDPGTDKKALFTVPRDSYVVTAAGELKNQTSVEVAGKKGRWVPYCGGEGRVVGYVFEGFLAPEAGLKSVELESKNITAGAITTSAGTFAWTEQTPFSGAWYEKDDKAPFRRAAAYENGISLNRLKELIHNDDGYIVMVVRDNRVLQFISSNPPRGME